MPARFTGSLAEPNGGAYASSNSARSFTVISAFKAVAKTSMRFYPHRPARRLARRAICRARKEFSSRPAPRRDIKTIPQRDRRLQEQVVTFHDSTTDEIWQTTIGNRHMRTALEHDNLAVLAQPPRARRGAGAAGHDANHNNFACSFHGKFQRTSQESA